MSFDPICAALGGSKPKHINLDDYGITEALLGQFANGGGTVFVEDVGSFWDDVNTDCPIRASFAFNAYSRVNVTGVTTVNFRNEVNQFCFECIMDYNGGVYRVAAMIDNDNGNGIAANVTVRSATV